MSIIENHLAIWAEQYHLGICKVVLENLESLENTQTCRHGVRGSDGRNDITRHFYKKSIECSNKAGM